MLPKRRSPQALGLTPDEWIERKVSGRIRLTVEERRRVVDAHPQTSGPDLAKELGVTATTIYRDRAAAGTSTNVDSVADEVTVESQKRLPAGAEDSTYVEPDPEQNNLDWQPGPEPADRVLDVRAIRPRGRAYRK